MTFIGAGIGEVAIFDKDTRYHLAPNVAKIVPSMDINKYLMYYFMSPTGRKNIFQYKKQTAQPSLSMETIRNVILPLPPLEELQRIVDKIEELFAKLSEIKPIEEELKFLKDSFPNDMINSILNDAYTGKLINQNTSVWNSNKLIDCCKEIVTGNSISEYRSNAEAGEGYADIIFSGNDGSSGVIIEIKSGAKERSKELLQAAFEQIERQKYTSVFEDDAFINEIHVYAMVFSGKQCLVRCKNITVG